jgi:hypothetical protein
MEGGWRRSKWPLSSALWARRWALKSEALAATPWRANFGTRVWQAGPLKLDLPSLVAAAWLVDDDLT